MKKRLGMALERMQRGFLFMMGVLLALSVVDGTSVDASSVLFPEFVQTIQADGSLLPSSFGAGAGPVVGGDTELRGVAEFDLAGLSPVQQTVLSFRHIGGSGLLRIAVVAYEGNNQVDVSDFNAGSIAPLGTFFTSNVFGAVESFDITTVFNDAISNGLASLGIRLERVPGSEIGGVVFRQYDSLQIAVTKPPVIDVAVDVKPESCPNPVNVSSPGTLPVAIVGSDGVDVRAIDVASIRLAFTVAPVRSSLEDVATPFTPFLGKQTERDCTALGPDGLLDLSLKFENQEVRGAVEAALGREVVDGEVLQLPLTGNLLESFGGTPIRGEDVVVILKKGKK
jgi:hypothetical protein